MDILKRGIRLLLVLMVMLSACGGISVTAFADGSNQAAAVVAGSIEAEAPDFLTDAENVDAGDIDVQPLDASANVGNKAVSFPASDVSALAYTVDFEYTNPETGKPYTYHLEGAGSITLKELAVILGITTPDKADEFISNVADVRFSNEDLLKVQQSAHDGWVLNSLAPFSSEEALNIPMKNGAMIGVRVTDVQESANLSDFLTNAVIVGATQNENGQYIVEQGVDYSIILSFAEGSRYQFDNDGTLTYQMPEGMKILSEQSGRSVINIVYKGRTYSVDYRDNNRYFEKSLFQPTPDSEFIGIMQEAVGSVHHSVTIDNYDLYTALTDAVDARDLPGMVDVDSSLLLFCRKIKEDFTVGLSGECADELFGGYPWYHNAEILFEDTFPWSRSLDIRRSVLKDGLLPKGEEYVRQRYLDTCRHTEKLRTDSRLDSRMREMFSLNFYWFMQCLLDRKDRMSMYSGLEVRVPFCDYRIVDYAYNMPWKIKSLGGREKGILRAAFRGLLPDSIIDRKKSPYPKTHNPLYFELCANKVREILSDSSSPLRDLIDSEGVTAIIESPEKISSPWYGQLMNVPQMMAFFVQLDYWLKRYNIRIV